MTSSTNTSLAIAIADVLPIVDAVVAQMGRHLPSHVSAQDLASAGKLALMEVLSDFNGSFAQDRGYVVCRVRGAVMDEMRRLDPLSRHGRSQVRRLRKTVATLEVELNRTPTELEVAERSGLPVEAISKIDQLGVAAERLNMDPFDGGASVRTVVDNDAPSPAEVAEESDSALAVQAAIQRLTAGQSGVLQRYYFGGLTLQEIAKEMGISVVRAHQLRVSAESRLREDAVIMDLWAALTA